MLYKMNMTSYVIGNDHSSTPSTGYVEPVTQSSTSNIGVHIWQAISIQSCRHRPRCRSRPLEYAHVVIDPVVDLDHLSKPWTSYLKLVMPSSTSTTRVHLQEAILSRSCRHQPRRWLRPLEHTAVRLPQWLHRLQLRHQIRPLRHATIGLGLPGANHITTGNIFDHDCSNMHPQASPELSLGTLDTCSGLKEDNNFKIPSDRFSKFAWRLRS